MLVTTYFKYVYEFFQPSCNFIQLTVQTQIRQYNQSTDHVSFFYTSLNSFNKMIFTSSFFLFLICFCFILFFFFFSNTRSLACPNTAQTHHHQVFPILRLGALIKYKFFTINECHRSNSRIFKGICKGRSTEFAHNHKIFKQN